MATTNWDAQEGALRLLSIGHGPAASSSSPQDTFLNEIKTDTSSRDVLCDAQLDPDNDDEPDLRAPAALCAFFRHYSHYQR